MTEKEGEKPEKGKKTPEEEKEPETPIAEFGVSFGGLFKDLGKFINSIMKLAEKAQEMEKTGELRGKAGKLRGMYGINVRVGRGGRPIIQEFGIKRPTLKPGEEVREPLVDVFDEDGEITVTAELPGVKKGDIKVEVEGAKLEINAETGDRKYAKEIELPAKVKGEPEIGYKNGVLDIKLTKA